MIRQIGIGKFLLALAAAIGVGVVGLFGGSGRAWAANTPGLQYGVPITLPTAAGLGEPAGVAVDSGQSLYVLYSDGGYGTVMRFPKSTAGGGYGPGIRLPFNDLNEPTAIAVDQAGDVFVSDVGLGQVEEVRKVAGGYRTGVKVPGSGGTWWGVAVDSYGDVFLSGYTGVYEVGPESPATGGYANQLALTGLSTPMALAVDSSDHLYVADQGYDSVLEYTSPYEDGQYDPDPVTLPFAGLSNPTAVAVDAAGDVFVLDQGNQNVVEMRKGSGDQITLPLGGLNTSSPSGVALDASGDVFVATGNLYGPGTGLIELPAFVPRPGAATAISVGANGSVWALGTNPIAGGYGIYRWNGGGWAAVAGAAVRIAVDPGGNPWVVSAGHQIYHWNGNGFVHYAGAATDVSVGANGSVWVLGATPVAGGYGICHWNGRGWSTVTGVAVRIAVDPAGNPWLVNAGHQIYHWNGRGWISYPGVATDIGVGSNGSVWVVGTGSTTGGYLLYHWSGGGWTQVPGGAVRIAVDATGNPWVVDATHHLYSA